eukprot:363123-Chlamydomonas_euryale.AAC.3
MGLAAIQALGGHAGVALSRLQVDMKVWLCPGSRCISVALKWAAHPRPANLSGIAATNHGAPGPAAAAAGSQTRGPYPQSSCARQARGTRASDGYSLKKCCNMNRQTRQLGRTPAPR